jgi:undecaprenyl-diphosphatase
LDIPLLLKAFILGLIEGLTEFLPVSSTGHLIIAGDLLDFNDAKGKVFEIVIQLGAILAVCWEFRARLSGVVRGLGCEAAANRFVVNLVVGFLPAGVLGLMLHKLIKEHLFNPFTVAVALIVGALVIFWVERMNHAPRVNSIDDMDWKDALKVGFAQSVAMFPGTSRSGATIIGGMLFGLSRQTATEFSFYLAIPTMFAATFYDVYKNWAVLSLDDLDVFATGFVVSFISAFWAVKGLLRYVAHHNFNAFAWYRLVLGIIVLFYFW